MFSFNQKILLEILHRDPQKPDRSKFMKFDQRNWDEFTEAAVHYRLAYQVYEYLESVPDVSTLLPDHNRERLMGSVRRQLHYNFSQIKRLRRILLSCAEQNVQPLIFKGLWLVENVYKDPRARLSGDIDLLVRPADMMAFTRAAKQAGCIVPLGVENLQSLAPFGNEYSLVFGKGETIIDVHWAIVSPNDSVCVDESLLWASSEGATVGNIPCHVLELEDHLLYLCFHAAIHHRFVYVGPRALLDIATMIDRPPREICWNKLVLRAHAFGWTRGAWLVFELIHQHLGVCPPENVMEQLKPVDLPGRETLDKAMEAIFLDQSHPTPLSLNVIRFFDAKWPAKLKLLKQRIFLTQNEKAEWLLKNSDDSRSRGFYFFRICQLLKVHGFSILQIMFGNQERAREKERRVSLSNWLELK